MMYFNQMFSNIVTSASSHSKLHDDDDDDDDGGGGDHTETCWGYCNFNLNCYTLLKNYLVHQLVIKKNFYNSRMHITKCEKKKTGKTIVPQIAASTQNSQ